MNGTSMDTSEIDLEIGLLRERLRDAEELRRAICEGDLEALVCGPGEKIHMLVPHAAELEAEATLGAIHRGEVDAFVVAGERVVTLDSALQPYQLLADRMHQGAATTTAHGDIAYVNERFATVMIRSPRSHLLARPLADLISPPDRAVYQSALHAAVKGGSAQCEFSLMGADRQAVAVHATATALGGGQTMWLFSDMSLQKRHAATDERTRKFLSMLAHEFRGMLSTIGYSAAYIKATGKLDDKGRDAVDTIERQTQRLSALVEDLRSVNPRE